MALQLCVLTAARPGEIFTPEPFAIKSVVELQLYPVRVGKGMSVLLCLKLGGEDSNGPIEPGEGLAVP